ncbi:MAG TPA: VCBS repeat-containing protein, partial [Phnomibacter sp.]|nr:VCBS repeat-containing protein [Phnomibacter sp.]
MQLIMAITNYLFSQKPGQYVSKTGNLLPVMGLLVIACRQPNALFTPLSSSHTGISFNNRLVEDEELNVLNYTYFYNGGGVAAADLNNDGLPDLVFTGNMVKNRLYLNKGNLKFEDITDQSGIAALQGWCTGVTLADVNADGWLDIYICRSADVEPERRKNLLYLN